MPEVSAVIPLFNKGPYIGRALDSVLNQTFKDFEIIVVDDGSTDESAEIVKRFQDQRIQLIHQENQGVSAARNRGVEQSVGKFIAFLDADDAWLSDHLETLVRLKKKFPDAGLYATAYFTSITKGDIKGNSLFGIPISPWEGIIPSYFLAATRSSMLISTSSIGIPKNIFREFNGFRIGLNFCEDSELWGRIALEYAIAFSWSGGSIYYLEGDNRLGNQLIDFEHPFIKIAEKAIRENHVFTTNVNDLKEYIVFLKLIFVRQNIMLGKNKIARNILKGCDTKMFKFIKYRLLLFSFVPRSWFLTIWKTKRKINHVFFKVNYEYDPWNPKNNDI